MLAEQCCTQPSADLCRALYSVQVCGDPVVVYPALLPDTFETIVEQARRCGLRMANVPPGGLTLLPPIPLANDELHDVCRAYCFAATPQIRAALRAALYLRDYPHFTANAANSEALYHPADVVTRVMHLCFAVAAATREQLDVVQMSCWPAYLQVSPVKEISAALRGECVRACKGSGAGACNVHEVHDGMGSKLGDDGGGHTHYMLLAASASGGVDVEHASRSSSLARTLPHVTTVADSTAATAATSATVDALTGSEVVDEVRGRAVAPYVDDTDGRYTLVTQSSVHYDGDGDAARLAAVFVAGALHPRVCAPAAAALAPAATSRNLRAATNGGTPPHTGIVGYYDYLTNPVQYKCRETEYMRRHWQTVHDGCADFLHELDALYRRAAPQHYNLQRVAIPTAYRLLGTVFSTITVNRNFRTALHTDKGDFRNGLGALCVLDGAFEGCHLVIPRLKKAFRLQVGDVLFFDTALEHGNTAPRGRGGAAWSRLSVVCYLRTGLLSSVCEMERRRRLHASVLQQQQQLLARAGDGGAAEQAINVNAADASLPPLYVPSRLASRLAMAQLAALNFVVERTSRDSGCVVAMTMGLGKTLVALTLCYSYLCQWPSRDVLIVVPKPIIPHWAQEQAKWRAYGLHVPHFVVADDVNGLPFAEALMHYEQHLARRRTTASPPHTPYAPASSHDSDGSGSSGNGSDDGRGRVFVLNPEYISTFLRRFRGFDPMLLLVDEGHRVAAKSSKLTEHLSRLRCRRRVVFSGTPVQNDATELYRLVAWVNEDVRHVVAPRRFLELASDINRYVRGDDDALEAAVAAQRYMDEWMRGFVFREMECDLPPLHDYLLLCGCSATQRTLERQHAAHLASSRQQQAQQHAQQQVRHEVRTQRDNNSSDDDDDTYRSGDDDEDNNDDDDHIVTATSDDGEPQPPPQRQQRRTRRRGDGGDGVVSVSATEHWTYHLSTHPLSYLAFVSDGYKTITGDNVKHGDKDDESDDEGDDEGDEDAVADGDGAAAAVATMTATMSSPSSPPSSRALARRALVTREHAFVTHCHELVCAVRVDEFVRYSGKLTALVTIVRAIVAQQREKVIIFSQYIGVQDLIHRTLTAYNIVAFTVRGRDAVERRRAAMQQFSEDANMRVLVLSTKIAAYGLDFTAANHVILFDSWWNPQVDAQAVARAYRRNQQRPVTVYRLAATSLDGGVVRAQVRKMALFDCIMRDKASRVARSEELRDCASAEADAMRRDLWARLKDTSLEGGEHALLAVYKYRDTVKEHTTGCRTCC